MNGLCKGLLEFDYEDEDEKDSFLEKFYAYYIGLYPDGDDFCIWLETSEEFPELYQEMMDLQEIKANRSRSTSSESSTLETYFDWESFTRDQMLNGYIWTETAPVAEWTKNDQGYMQTSYVFRSIGTFSTDWDLKD